MKLTGVAVAACFAATLTAQEPYRASTDLVLLSVTVTDADGHLVPGLAREDFQVFEDGAPQTLYTFSRDPQPIALELLLDTSASMDKKLPIAQEAAVGFMRRMNPADVAQIVAFSSRQSVLQSFTGDKGALERAIRKTEAGGSTSFYNAMYTALTDLRGIRMSENPGDIRRQAAVVLSDGEDTSSVVSFDEVLDLAKRADVAIYAVGLRDKPDRLSRSYNEGTYVLRSLAQETGGRAIFVEDPTQLPAIYQQIADELANQYTMSYSSKNLKRDGAWRTIAVRITKPGAAARTKSGYFGPTVRR